ncbi:MAG: ATP-binding protein, partial [Bacteroidota bacterium]
IYFGTISGVVSFHPDDFTDSEAYQAAINIVKFEKYRNDDQQITDHTVELLDQQRIVLEPNDRFFRLSIRMADYFNSENTQYQYKVKGLFEDFQTISANVIELGRLPYGRYQLIVRGQGANRQYSEEELVLPLVVKRPLYLQWWFLALVSALFIFGAVQFYYWRIKRLKEREQRLKLLVAARTAQIQKDKNTIEEQAIQLKELDELKSKFFANISHELRTPLTLILAPLSNLLKTNAFSNKQHTQLLLMQQNGQKLLKRINELLDISRIDANKLEVQNQPVFLYPFLKTLLSTFESSANLKNIQLQFDYQLDEEIQLSLDEDKLEKIVMNYLSNALKFTSKNGTISLSVKKEQQKLQLSVTDTGIGIPEKDLPKIFDRFYQVDNSPQGTGIGLSLSKELAKVMQGRVWVTSIMNTGSTFHLELPFVETFAVKKAEEKEAIVAPIIEQQANTTQPHQKTILVAEDNPDLRAFLKLILEAKYNVVAVENGKVALELLENPSLSEAAMSHSFSAIISDIMMPEMDGIELLTRLKASDDLRHLPVILLTARKSLNVKIDALRIGVDDYLTKPFKSEELLARVNNLIQNVEQRIAQLPNKATNRPKAVSIADTNWLKEVEGIILENVENGDFTLNQLAETLHITARTLQTKIKHITGKTPKQYQRDLQMHVARQKIKSGTVQTIAELGYQLGFDNPYYFAKLYKQYYGVTPKEDMQT